MKGSPKRPKPMVDLTGTRFGRLTVTGFAGHRLDKQGRRRDRLWSVRCDCGTEAGSRQYRDLKSGNVASCGCLQRERASEATRKHGESKTLLYKAFRQMHSRCSSPSNDAWERYGARGIRVCDRWKDFETFRKDMGVRPPGAQLDRIDNDGPYSPENCRWATSKQQTRNYSRNVNLTYRGETMCMQDWAKRFNLRSDTLRVRIRAGWSTERALETPVLRSRFGEDDGKPRWRKGARK